MKALSIITITNLFLIVLSTATLSLNDRELTKKKFLRNAFNMTGGYSGIFSKSMFLTHPSFNMFRNKKELSLDERKTEDRLDSFYINLQKFLNATYFDSAAFEIQMPDLWYEITDIEIYIHMEEVFRQLSEFGNFIESRDSPQTDLIDKLRFSKYMFRAMVESVQALNFFNKTGNLGHHLVRCVIQLNVRLLRLKNSRGIPDPSLQDFVGEIALHSEYLNIWRGLFATLTDNSYSVSRKFSEQSVQAENTLRVLARSIN